jgi:hypothetical protein
MVNKALKFHPKSPMKQPRKKLKPKTNPTIKGKEMERKKKRENLDSCQIICLDKR